MFLCFLWHSIREVVARFSHRDPALDQRHSVLHGPLAIAMLCALVTSSLRAAQPLPSLAEEYRDRILPLLGRYCYDCHADDVTEAEVDFASFTTLAVVRSRSDVWQKVRYMLASRQMPPKDAPQPSDTELTSLQSWVGRLLVEEARASAGDPGPVPLRRLTNDEYAYTIRDLTGVTSLQPTNEFPVDGAAGEGFTNVGAAQGMSPALLQKYYEAAKGIAAHAALFPDGIRFSRSTTRRDLTDEILAKIRAFYARYTTRGGGSSVNLQGIKFDTNEGGLLPLREYLTATVEEREALRAGQTTVDAVARRRQLSPKYLKTLWRALAESDSPSMLLDRIRLRWRNATPEEVPSLADDITAWQKQLWKFNVVGHVGREGAPRSWMEPVTPIADREEFRVKLPKPNDGDDVVVYLSASDAGDGNDNDYVVWRDLRIEGNGQPTLRLRDVAWVARAKNAAPKGSDCTDSRLSGRSCGSKRRCGCCSVGRRARRYARHAARVVGLLGYEC